MATYLLIISLISLLVPSSLGQCNKERALPYFRRSVYEFSINLVSRIAQENENHFVASALSPWTLLSAVSLGAADETLDEIKQVLRLHPHKCFNSKFFEIAQELTAAKDGTVLERSSTCFVDNRMPLNQVFRDRIKKTKITGLQELQFDDFTAVANTINDYVSTATHGNINEIVEPAELQGVYIILIDALYFKGSWTNKFLPEETEFSSFYDERGNQIGDVYLMFAQQEANYTAVSQIEASVLELPYGDNTRFSMLFILPDQGKTISSVLDNMKSISLSSIFRLFEQTGSQEVVIQIPRFKINSDLNNMKEWLTDMGLKTMFDSNLARFPDISDYSLYISDIIQKATVEVNEEGTEASAATAAEFEGRSLPMQMAEFTANRPFLFMIVDRQLELALFTGAYSKPSAL